MKNLFLNSLILFLPFILALIFLPVNKRFFYQGLKDDCSNHATWIYDRLYNNSKPMDIVFMGSSKTINGINDQLIGDTLNNGMGVINMGYCRLGNNLYYSFLKELIEVRKIKVLVMEVREDENRYSHPVFPYLASFSDVVCAPVLFNKNYLSDYYQYFYYKLEVIKKY